MSTRHEFSVFKSILFVLILILCPACAEKKMTLKEAKQVTVSMSEKPFVPPPRRMDDILAMLDQPGQFDPYAILLHKDRADAPPWNTQNPTVLATQYFTRGKSARELGRFKQSLEDLRKALNYAETAGGENIRPMHAGILGYLSQVEAEFGNFSHAIALTERALKIDRWSMHYVTLTSQYISAGDLRAAQEMKEAGVRLCDDIISDASKSDLSRTWATIHKAGMQAAMLEARGNSAEAEPYRRYVLKLMNDPIKRVIIIRKHPRSYLMARHKLANNLRRQGRFAEAEVEAREALKESLALGGKGSETNGRILTLLGMIYTSQGRLNDAEAITRATIRNYEMIGLPGDSSRVAYPKMLLGTILFARQNYTEAMKHYDSGKVSMLENQFYYENHFSKSPHVILSLLKTGRTEEALATISKYYEKDIRYFGKKSYRMAQMMGLRGMAHAQMGNELQALRDFSESVPILLKTTGVRSSYLKNLRVRIIVESYLDLLTKIHNTRREKEFGVNASPEMFMLCQGISESIVQRALGASGARAAAVDPELADIVRKEQDACQHIDALETILSEAIAIPSDQQNPDALEDLKDTIESIKHARSVLLDEIKRRFPKYADFTNPKPVTFSLAQKHLRPREALVVIFPAASYTYVWAIPHNGDVHFKVVSLNEADLHRIVEQLREAIEIDPGTFGDIPAFDFTRAYDLYSKLLKPVQKGWRHAKDLIVVAHGPLAQLPFSLLPTSLVALGAEKGALFSNYRKVPWLIRKVSITRQPTVSSFTTLREIPEGDPDRKAFVGFGDPIFDRTQIAMAENKKDNPPVESSSAGDRVRVRGIRVTKQGKLDNAQILSTHLGSLNRLPDTADEIKSMAKTLEADPSRDCFLGKSASEKQVKTMDLSNRRVIAFASHALVPGDLDGLYQPAIALSAPSVTGDKDDGLLTMGEVLKLLLNADWVVLSACNTGAAEGAGAEAVSGLGRAFFYAGTRALLVSMWPVETTSAKKLTTGLFQYQKKNKKLSKVRAHQKSMLALIDSPGLIDNTTEKIVASYAHPFFWAPFIVVGDGR
jgi:CHAT domain-containing protein